MVPVSVGRSVSIFKSYPPEIAVSHSSHRLSKNASASLISRTAKSASPMSTPRPPSITS